MMMETDGGIAAMAKMGRPKAWGSAWV